FADHYAGFGYGSGIANRCSGRRKTGTASRRRHMFRLFAVGRCGFLRAKCAARRFRVRLPCAADHWRDLSQLFGNQIDRSRIRVAFFKQRCRTSLGKRQSPRRLSVVEARFVDEPFESQGWRLLSEFPAAIIPAGVQVWSFSILLALIHATEGLL